MTGMEGRSDVGLESDWGGAGSSWGADEAELRGRDRE